MNHQNDEPQMDSRTGSPILAESNIKATLDAYPELKEVLIDLSPKFKRMQNVAVYNTLARFANFNDAAKISGVAVCEILNAINGHLGIEQDLDNSKTETADSETSSFETESEPVSWGEGPERYVYSDKSIPSLIQKVSELAPQKSLVVFSIEKPDALLKVAAAYKHRYNLEHRREYRTSIFNPGERPVEKWIDQKKSFEILDARSLPGNPLDVILEKAEGLQGGQGFILIQSFEPIPMIKKLTQMGFDYLSEQISDDEFRVSFYKKVEE